eukprot:SRR837773.3715.p1 GENE.SRR837773.3715~~SRR837773.3715.p1  ORF type:complete len:200 (-),score=51.47 SRR837773.3715:41-574(-)
MRPVDRIQNMQEWQDGDSWRATIKSGPTLIKAYQVVTSTRGDPALDPVEWTLEGSIDGVDWTVLDESPDVDVPRERGAATQIMDELAHQQAANMAFRSAFLVEVLSNVLAFAWLLLGTYWVGLGSVDCVDSAPLLYYPSFFLVVIVWSFLGTMTIALVMSAVAMVAMGSRPSGPAPQ